MEELQKDILNCFLAYAIHADSPKEYAFRGFFPNENPKPKQTV